MQEPPVPALPPIQAEAVHAELVNADEGYSQRWAIQLCELGNPKTAVYACLCLPCALAEARSNMDESPMLFNLACLPACCVAPQRWLLRTAYHIPGDACTDSSSALLPCCAANQMLQTSQQHGNVSIGGGPRFNRRPWRYGVGSMGDDAGQCVYSSLCCCAATGRALENSMGMPCFMGCCCITPCAARNLVRYQYRLDGEDLLEEASLPLSAALMATGAAYTPIAALPLLALISLQTDIEARHRSGGGVASGYLTTKGFRPRSSRSRLAHVWGARERSRARGDGDTAEAEAEAEDDEEEAAAAGLDDSTGRGGSQESTPLLREARGEEAAAAAKKRHPPLQSKSPLRARPDRGADWTHVQGQGQGQGRPGKDAGTERAMDGDTEEQAQQQQQAELERELEQEEKLRQMARERLFLRPAVAAQPVDEFQAAVWARAETSYDLFAGGGYTFA